MRTSPTIGKIAPALVAIQAELTSIAKDARNPHFGSKYLSNDALIEAVRPIVAAARCALVQSAAPEDMTPFYVSTTLVHESGEWIESGIPITLSKNDPQGAGSGMTYGRRYSLSALLSISADADDDGNAASKPARQRAASQDSRPRTAATQQPGEAMPALAKPELFFGRPRGTPLGEYDDTQLKAMLSWCVEKNTAKSDPKMHQRIQTIRAILADRSLGQPTTEAERDAVAVSRLADKPDDGLPF